MNDRTTPLNRLPDNLAAWTDHFRHAEIPVLAATSETLEALRSNEDAVDANNLGEMMAGDPLMTLKVLAYAATHRTSRIVTDTETVTATLVMMGIPPFFRAFGRQPTVQDRLAAEPDALAGLLDVIHRAHRAADFALGFAVHRRDTDAAVIHEAALLHDFAEMLLWCEAPALALQLRDAQRSDPTLRSAAIQQRLLGIELSDLQQSLMRTWRLPELLIRISDDRHADNASVRSVVLAVQLARHSSLGWDNPALPDDIDAVAKLLNLSHAAALELVHDIAS